MKLKPILGIDFDGVIHSYISGWKGATIIPDMPVFLAKQSLIELQKSFNIIIFSCRANEHTNPGGKDAIEKYLKNHEIPFDEITSEKPPAFLVVDDRAITFQGDWKKTMKEIKDFKNWLKLKPPKED